MNPHRLLPWAGWLALAPLLAACVHPSLPTPTPTPTLAWQAAGDRIEQPLAGPGDVRRGYQLASRRESACILCHQLPSAQGGGALLDGGNIGPPLVGVGARLDLAQLRLRLVDSGRINAQSVMPSYYRIDHLQRVAPAYQGMPVLQAQQIEDILAWLESLK